MGDDNLGAIIYFTGNYCPIGYLFCDGTVYAKSQYPDLFNLLGSTYGGDGVSTFAVPNFNACIPMGQGPVSGTPLNLPMGKSIGEANHALTKAEMARHNHNLNCVSSVGTSNNPANMNLAQAKIPAGRTSLNVNLYQTSSSPLTNMFNLDPVGLGDPHNNMQPYIGLTFLICYQKS